jgi:hypothetical protein
VELAEGDVLQITYSVSWLAATLNFGGTVKRVREQLEAAYPVRVVWMEWGKLLMPDGNRRYGIKMQAQVINVAAGVVPLVYAGAIGASLLLGAVGGYIGGLFTSHALETWERIIKEQNKPEAVGGKLSVYAMWGVLGVIGLNVIKQFTGRR